MSDSARRPRKKSATRSASVSKRRALALPVKGGALTEPVDVGRLANDFGLLIENARAQVAHTVNAALTTLYWQIGHRVRVEVLDGHRAEYGAQIVAALGRQLQSRFGHGFGEKNLRRMVQFAEAFPEEKIVAALRRHLGWTHFKVLLPMKDALKRDFYAEMCRVEAWSTRTLQQKIDSMLYERTALSKKPDKLIKEELRALREHDEVTTDLVLQDPYILDFLGLKDTFSEKDLESALLREIERFLLELGAGFAFIERQKRIVVDGDDYYIDLLFFHRRLRRLVVIELKIGDFKPADAGQVQLYLRWLDGNERQRDEGPPLGMILCAGKKRETVEYMDLAQSGIHVAEYLTELPPREVLERRLHVALATARARLQRHGGHEGDDEEPK